MQRITPHVEIAGHSVAVFACWNEAGEPDNAQVLISKIADTDPIPSEAVALEIWDDVDAPMELASDEAPGPLQEIGGTFRTAVAVFMLFPTEGRTPTRARALVLGETVDLEFGPV